MKKNIYLLFLCLCIVPASSRAQNIFTLAGDGIGGFTGDGGPAAASRLFHPKATAVDAAGNVYIADADNNRIRMISTSGTISTIAGNATAGYGGDGMPAVSATLNRPSDIKIDAAGNIFICDANNHCIRKINTSGIISTVAGIPTTSGFGGDGGPATAAFLDLPTAIAVHPSGTLLIADQGNHRIRSVNSSGDISTFAGTGSTGYAGEGGPATAADIGFPYGVAIDGPGNVYISLLFQNIVCKVDVGGTITTFAGTGAAAFSGDGGPATAAELDGQWGIAVDAPGNLYIADYNNERIRKVNTSGIISTIAGTGSAGYGGDGGPATAATLREPVGISVRPDGSVYIADYNNHRLRRINATFTSPPSFVGPAIQTMAICQDAAPTSINSLLAANDADVGQAEYWAPVVSAVHGAVAASYTVTTTGSTLTPAGLTYTPSAGYSGTDSFTVRVYDGTASDTTRIIVTITPPPSAGTITGQDSVCVGFTQPLANAVTGGVWSSSNTARATVSSSGVVTGVAAGTLTISYVVTNSCGTATATMPYKVLPMTVSAGCVPGGVTPLSVKGPEIFPNPTSGSFIFNLPSVTNDKVTIVITNLLGEKVKELTTATNQQTNIVLDGPAGIYFLNAVTAHSSWTARISIAR